MSKQTSEPNNRDPDNESGRVSRSGTSAGIAVDNESTSGGRGPIPPGGDAPVPREEVERERHKR